MKDCQIYFWKETYFMHGPKMWKLKILLFFHWSLQVMEAATFGDKLFTGTLIFLTILAILVLFAVRNFGHGLLLLKHETYEHSGNYNWLYKTRPFVIFIWNRSEWKNKVKLLKKCLYYQTQGRQKPIDPTKFCLISETKIMNCLFLTETPKLHTYQW